MGGPAWLLAGAGHAHACFAFSRAWMRRGSKRGGLESMRPHVVIRSARTSWGRHPAPKPGCFPRDQTMWWPFFDLPMSSSHSSSLPYQVVALKDKAFVNPDLAVIHAPLAALSVAFPRERFLQVRGGIAGTHHWLLCPLHFRGRVYYR